MDDEQMLQLLEEEFQLLLRVANSNPIYTVVNGKRARRSLAWVVRTECEDILKQLRVHIVKHSPEGTI